jgi:hypothetical protein
MSTASPAGRFPPKSTIREIRINQNPYSPQFDGLGFNRVEIFTKPGGNTLHGSIFISGNDNAFNARNPYTTVLPPGDSLLIQAEVSGALNKKTSFALSSNYVNQQSAAIVNAPTSLDTNGNPVVLTQTVSSPTNTSNYTLRLDRQVTPANTFFSRYEYNSSTLTNSGVGLLVLASEGISTTTTQQTLQLGDTQSLGKNIVAETRFQYQRIRLDQTPNSTAPAIIVEGGFSGGGSPAGGLTDNQDHYEFQEYLSVSHGAHFIRAGGRYRLFRESNDSTANYNGTFTYNSLASYLATPNNTGASQFSITQGQSSAVLLTGDLGLYAEDEWKLRKNVTVNLGLRFETQSAIPDHSDPAPRIGASWAVGQTDKRKPFVVLRAGTGIFYQRFTAANLLTSVRQNGVSQQTYFVTNPAGDPTSLPPSSSYASTPPTPYTVSPNLRSSYEIISGLTAERSLGKYGQFTVNYLAIRGDHQFNSFNINAPLPDGTRPLGGTQNRYQFASEGIEKAQTVFANTNLNLTSKLHLFAFYIYRHQNGDTAGATSFASQPYNLKADYGPASGGFRANGQRLFTGSYAELPFGFTYDMFLSAQNGQPFNITTGTDLNGDTVYNDRPAFATDLSRASVVRSKYGNFDTQPIAGQTIIPYNDATSPGLFFMEFGVSRNFKFGPRPAAEPLPPGAPAPQGKVPLPDPKYRLVFEVDASNVLNHVNPGVPVSVLSSPEFGQSISQNPFFSQNNAANRVILLMTSFHF